jgi:hypothetical protein
MRRQSVKWSRCQRMRPMLKSKRPNKTRLTLSIVLCLQALFTLECAQYPTIVGDPPDIVVCTGLFNPRNGLIDTGWCRYTVSNKPFFVDNDKQTFYDVLSGRDLHWQDLMEMSVIVPPYSFAVAKSWQDDICHQLKCSGGVGNWTDLVNDIDLHVTGGKNQPQNYVREFKKK